MQQQLNCHWKTPVTTGLEREIETSVEQEEGEGKGESKRKRRGRFGEKKDVDTGTQK